MSGGLHRAGLSYYELRITRWGLLPSLAAWGVAAVLLQGLALAGVEVPGALRLLAIAVPAGAFTLAAVGIVAVNVVTQRHLSVKLRRARALVARLRSEGPETGLERIEGWLRWKEGRVAAGPRVLYREGYFPGLTSRPWHAAKDFPFAAELESAAAAIREELRGLGGDVDTYRAESPGSMVNWHTYYFYERYQRLDARARRFPATAALVDKITGGISRDSMFSLLGPGGLISPHSDPENIFLTCHLGLIVPEDCGIEVGGELRRWEEGRCVIFDAAFEHHAFNRSPSPRVLLLIDFLHPHFTEVERRFFKAYFAAEAPAA